MIIVISVFNFYNDLRCFNRQQQI